MSIKTMTRVWECSQAEGGALLVLLALADFANQDGVSWPSVESLCKRSRLGRRNVQYVLRTLEESGEIVCERNAGPRGTNLYRITVGAQPIARVQQTARVQPIARGGRNLRQKGAQPIAPEPPRTVKEPPLREGRKRKQKQKFQKPELETVSAYFLKRGSSKSEAENFHDHFESNGWRVGGKAPMRDWQAAARGWIRRAPQFEPRKNGRADPNAFPTADDKPKHVYRAEA